MHRLRLSAALLFSAALWIGLTTLAQANSVVYSLTSIPNANSVVYQDNFNPALTDTLSGTITISSSQSIFGTWNSGNFPSAPIILNYDFSLSNSNVSVNHVTGSEDVTTLINNGWIQGGGLTVTSAGLFIPNPNISGGQVLFQDGVQAFPPYPLVVAEWNGNFFSWGTGNNLNGATIEILAGPSGVPPVSSLYGSGATWQIATAAPEPSTLVLGVVAILGIFACRKLRRG